MDGPRPPVERLRQRRGHLPHLGPPRDRPLLQPPRPADHGGQGSGGAKIICVDTRLSNTGPRPTTGCRPGRAPSRSCCWRSPASSSRTAPGTRDFVERLGQLGDLPPRDAHPTCPCEFASVEQALLEAYAEYTPERAEQKTGVSTADTIREIAEIIGATRPSSPPTTGAPPVPATSAAGRWPAACSSSTCSPARWRPSAAPPATAGTRFKPPRPSGRPADHQVERAGVAEGVPAGLPRDVDPAPPLPQRGARQARRLLQPGLQPDLDQPRRLHLDGGADRRVDKVECHVALTPTWSETAWYADYVLPMGVASERHDLTPTRPTPAAGSGSASRCCAATPRSRPAGRRSDPDTRTHEYNPGEVWEENEFWIDLSWRIDPDGSLGIRQWFESPSGPAPRSASTSTTEAVREGSRACPTTPRPRPARRPLEFMRERGAFAVDGDMIEPYERPSTRPRSRAARRTSRGRVPQARHPGHLGRLRRDPRRPPARRSSATAPRRSRSTASSRRASRPRRRSSSCSRPPSSRLGLARVRHPDLDPVPRALGRPRHGGQRADPAPDVPDPDADPHPVGELEVAQRDQPPPSAVDPSVGCRDARHRGERPRPRHHPHRSLRDLGLAHRGHPPRRGRRLATTWAAGGSRRTRPARGEPARPHRERRHHAGSWCASTGCGRTTPAPIGDPDTQRIWWNDTGVHQNLTFAVQPDPISGMQCWHQRVHVTRAESGDEYGDVVVDTAKAREAYLDWLTKTRPAPGPRWPAPAPVVRPSTQTRAQRLPVSRPTLIAAPIATRSARAIERTRPEGYETRHDGIVQPPGIGSIGRRP